MIAARQRSRDISRVGSWAQGRQRQLEGPRAMPCAACKPRVQHYVHTCRSARSGDAAATGVWDKHCARDLAAGDGAGAGGEAATPVRIRPRVRLAGRGADARVLAAGVQPCRGAGARLRLLGVIHRRVVQQGNMPCGTRHILACFSLGYCQISLFLGARKVCFRGLPVRHRLPHRSQKPRTAPAALPPAAVSLRVRLQRGAWAAGAASSRAPAAPQAPAELSAAARLAAARRAEALPTLPSRPRLPVEPSAPVSGPLSEPLQGAMD